MALNTNIKKKSEFDFDLKFGRKRENRLHKLLGMRAEDKVEVKTETHNSWNRNDRPFKA